jgi:hypothetical protein
MEKRSSVWTGVVIGIVVAIASTLLFNVVLPPGSFMAAAPVLIPGAVLLLAVLWWRRPAS